MENEPEERPDSVIEHRPARDARVSALADVIEAMRSIQNESDRWKLAEALRKEYPSGLSGFKELIDDAASAGIEGYSINTLRLYRDCAARWPEAKRVEGVSFTAHRIALGLDNVDEAQKVLQGLAKNLGPSKVTVQSVRKAILTKQGKAPKPSKGSVPAPKQPAAFDVTSDIASGATKLIAAIPSSTEPEVLDKLHAGLTKAIGHVERLKAKAARKAATAKKAPAAAPKKAAPKKATTSKAQGDLRGL